MPEHPPASAQTPPFDAIDDHEALLSWSRAYGRRVVAATDLAVDLDRVDWEVSTRAKRRAAAVIHPRVAETSPGQPVDWRDHDAGEGGPPQCTVRLTWRAALAYDRQAWARTLRHELVHVEQFQRWGATGHGPDFTERARTLETTVRCELFATPKYVLSCPDCGKIVARRYRDCKLVRRHEDYRSSCCDASLSMRRTGVSTE